MPGRIDVLEGSESLRRAVLLSMAVHAAAFSLMAYYTHAGTQAGVEWGNPHPLGGGTAVGITTVKQIPLPARTGAANPLANDTESRVPLPPKPQAEKVRAPEPDAIAIRGRQRPPQPERPRQYAQYRPGPERPNQLYSNSGQALSSTMFGAQTGAGGVGIGPGGAFGSRFGWYRDLLEQRVAQKWRTEEVDARLQTAPAVVVTFEILRDGSIRNLRILQRSGYSGLDYSAQRAVYEAAPFPALPQGYERPSAQIEIWFQLKR
ncbi:MAG: TonB family protein [Bryobacteraceae bacterium]